MSLLSPFLWSLLPSQLTHAILPTLTTTLPQIFPPSPRNTPTYARNYRIVFTLLVLGYLAYSFVLEGKGGDDWYDLLGVGRRVDDDGLRRAFRKLSRIHHPDRAGASNEDTFITLRRAYETLSDPVKRYAYDRFGPDTVQWKGLTTREHIHTGLMQSLGFYIVSGGFMLALSLLGRAREAAFWRHILLILLLILELNLLLSPTPSNPQSSLFLRRSTPRVLHQPQFLQIRLLHRLFTSASIAFTQLAGVWSPTKPDTTEQGFLQIASLVRSIEMEAVGAFQSEVVPVLTAGEPTELEKVMKSGMEQVLVDRAVASHPQIRAVWQEAARRLPPRPVSRRHATYPTPPPEARPLRPGKDVTELELARGIPLPPSPPATPPPRFVDLPG